jgi:hypothetical protein
MKIPAEFSLSLGKRRTGDPQEPGLALKAINRGGQPPGTSGRDHRTQGRFRQPTLVAHNRWKASNGRLDQDQRGGLGAFTGNYEEIDSVIEALSCVSFDMTVVRDSRLTRRRRGDLSRQGPGPRYM